VAHGNNIGQSPAGVGRGGRGQAAQGGVEERGLGHGRSAVGDDGLLHLDQLRWCGGDGAAGATVAELAATLDQ